MILGDDDNVGKLVVELFYSHLPEFETRANVIRYDSRTIVEAEKYQAQICEHPVWELTTDAFIRKFKLISRSSLTEYIFSIKVYYNYGFKEYPMA